MKLKRLKKTSKQAVAFVLFLLQIAALFAVSAQLQLPAEAEGSASLASQGGYRPYLEYSVYSELHIPDTTSYQTAGVDRRTVLNVYLKQGETLYFGSNIYNSRLSVDHAYTAQQTGADIVLVTPDSQSVAYDTLQGGVGYIGSVTQESAGPKIGDTPAAGYTPHSFQATVEGIYQIHFHSILGINSTETGLPRNPTPISAQSSQTRDSGATVTYWDITVVDGEGERKPGRTFTKMLSLNMGGNNVSLDSRVYVVTSDGFIYETDFNGMDPYGFIFFANNRGFVSASENYTRYESFRLSNNSLNATDMATLDLAFHNPWYADTELDKTFNIFLEQPDPELEGTLYPRAYAPQPATNIKFVGTQGDDRTYIGCGGYFQFDITRATSATVKIDLTHLPRYDEYGEPVYEADGTTMVFDDYGIVELSNPVVTGHNSFYWNGKDAQGLVDVPIGRYTGTHIGVTVETHSGEYHFPMIDVERNPNGLRVTRVNKIYQQQVENGEIVDADVSADFDAAGKSIVFYDNSHIENSLVSGVRIADGVGDYKTTGVDSSLGAMAFTTNGFGSGAGDQTLLDIWTYSNNAVAISSPLLTDIEIIDIPSCMISGLTFFDAGKTGAFNLMDGDFMLSGIAVELYELGTDEQGAPTRTLVGSTTTDSRGEYFFYGIPVGVEPVQYETVVYKPMPIYEVTTDAFSTNSGQTLGTLVQQISIGGVDSGGEIVVVPIVEMSDVGFYYEATAIGLEISKDWVVNQSLDPQRPESIVISVQAYYNNGVEDVTVSVTDYTLSYLNSWRLALTNMPRYADLTAQENGWQTKYRVISETFTPRGESYEWTCAVDGDGYVATTTSPEPIEYPYNTSFTTNEIIGTHVITAANEPKYSSYQVNKFSLSDPQLPLAGAGFALWQRTEYTAMTDIPSPYDPAEYIQLADGIYRLLQTGVTNVNGVLGFTGLVAGHYCVIEQSAPLGYELDATPYPFEIVAGEPAYLQQTIYNGAETDSISVTKIIDIARAGSSIPITVTVADDAAFTQNVSTQTQTITTDDSTLSFPPLDFGRFTSGRYFKVEESPSSYQFEGATLIATAKADGTQSSSAYVPGAAVLLEAGYDYSVVLSNVKGPDSITLSLTKRIDVPMVDAEIPITLSIAANEEFTEQLQTLNYTVGTHSSQTSYNVATITLTGGSYFKVSEGACSYRFSSAQLTKTTLAGTSVGTQAVSLDTPVLLEDGYNYALTLVNTAQYVDTFYSQKLWIDENGELLDAEKYLSTGEDGSTPATKQEASAATATNGNVDFTIRRSIDGGVSWESVLRGTNNNNYFVNVSGSSPFIQAAASNVGDNSSMLIWTKRFGAIWWHLPQYDNNGNAYLYDVVESALSAEQQAAGWVQYTGEISYSADGKTASFVNPTTGRLQTVYTAASASPTDPALGDVYRRDFQSSYYLINYKLPTDALNMSVKKVATDGVTPLTGAQFGLYSDAECTVSFGVPQTTAMDGDAAVASFTDIPPGVYYLRELEAPPGYQRPGGTIEIVITQNGSEFTVSAGGVAVEGVFAAGDTFSITIQNDRVLELPISGAWLTADMWRGMALVMITAIALLLYSGRVRRRRAPIAERAQCDSRRADEHDSG